MAEIRCEVKTFEIIKECDKCEDGEMVCLGILGEYGDWLHECNKCGCEEEFEEKYPQKTHERVNGHYIERV